MRDRLVARFIVAPARYGKTCLAIDYAETMFSWAHVFWLNAKSPCFIRDLDDGDIARECIAADPDVKLVVIEDVPQLDAQRTEQLSHEIDALLAHGCEVLATCAPSCDLVGSLQIDRLRLSAGDLLLDDDELDASRSDEERLRMPSSRIPKACRVPGLMWDSSPESAVRFVEGNLGEGIPADLLLVTATVFILHRGSFDDLARIGPVERLIAEDVLADYPHLGFGFEEGCFEAPLLDAEVVAQALKAELTALAERSAFPTRVDLAYSWADAALDGNRTDRACDVIRVLCPTKEKAQWLVAHARSLVGDASFHPALKLIGSLRRGQFEAKDRVRAFEALCCRMLGDEDRAIKLAKGCAFSSAGHDDARAVGLVITARLAKGTLLESTEALIRDWALTIGADKPHTLEWHEALVLAWAVRGEGLERLVGAWTSLRDRGIDEDILCVIASWSYGLVQGGENCADEAEAVEPLERFLRARLATEDAAFDFFAASAGLAMEEAHARGMPFSDGPLPAEVLLELRRVEMAMLYQRRQYERSESRDRATQAKWPGVAPSASRVQVGLDNVDAPRVPLLDVKAFGRFDVSLGGVPLELSSMKRKHTRELLVLLATNWRRDVPIDLLASAMWPTSSQAVARKNFYTIWSQLKRAVTLPDGTCPYLVRTQYGCRLNDRYVKSDIARLGDICRELLIGRLDFDAWLEYYNEIDRDFSGELLPTESGNHLIVKAREEYRERLVDALTTASLRLVDADNSQWGIWFARAALAHEPTREDVYVALMRAQIAHGQRTAAMMTYLNCRRVLSDELGIDPSPETRAIYDSLLDS